VYHYTKEGWKIWLIEKGELTSGSTWHAAGQCPHMVGSYNLAKSFTFYKSLQTIRRRNRASNWFP
jgi:dimethylglycine dehydrogenase